MDKKVQHQYQHAVPKYQHLLIEKPKEDEEEKRPYQPSGHISLTKFITHNFPNTGYF
jgi:hypothetical protein